MGTPWWRPKNETEEAMAAALRRGDPAAYFRALIDGTLYVPEYSDEVITEPSVLIQHFGDDTAVQVYTSLEGLRVMLRDVVDTHTTMSYAELQARFPQPEWRLAINFGFPITAYVPLPAVAQVADGRLLVVDNRLVKAGETEPLAGVRPVFDPHAAAQLELASQDMDAQMLALRDATVYIPTKWQIDDTDDLLDPEFPLIVTERDTGLTIEMFTAAETLTAAHPDAPYVALPVPVLMALLPDRVGLVLDPGTPNERDVRDALLALLMVHIAERRPDDSHRLLEQIDSFPASGRGAAREATDA